MAKKITTGTVISGFYVRLSYRGDGYDEKTNETYALFCTNKNCSATSVVGAYNVTAQYWLGFNEKSLNPMNIDLNALYDKIDLSKTKLMRLMDGTSPKRVMSDASQSDKSPASAFVYVPAGTFTMGTNSKTVADIAPAHSVTLSSFYMLNHEVTQKEYKALLGKTPSFFKNTDNPVEQVSWYDAIVYCNTLSIKEGLTPCYTISGSTDPKKWGAVPSYENGYANRAAFDAVTCNFAATGYRLPTEAEWEYVARDMGSSTNEKAYASAIYKIIDSYFSAPSFLNAWEFHTNHPSANWISINSRFSTQPVMTKDCTKLASTT